MMRLNKKNILLLVGCTLLVSSSIIITFSFPLKQIVLFGTISKGSFCDLRNHSEHIINTDEEFIEL